MTQQQLLLEYFKKHPNREIEHKEIVDWATAEWQRATGKVFRDPDRGIRKLYQKGFLIKVRKGVYKYDPDYVQSKKQEDFTSAQKQAIFQRDNYKCVICGQGKYEGVELHADHIRPKELGGKATLIARDKHCYELSPPPKPHTKSRTKLKP